MSNSKLLNTDSWIRAQTEYNPNSSGFIMHVTNLRPLSDFHRREKEKFTSKLYATFFYKLRKMKEEKLLEPQDFFLGNLFKINR